MNEIDKRWMREHARTHRRLENTCNVFGGVWAAFWWLATSYIAYTTYLTDGNIAVGDHGIAIVFLLIAISETASIFKKGKMKKKAEFWERNAK